MITTHIDAVPGKKIIEHYGLVQGSTVRAKRALSDIGASFKNMIGGELKTYTKLMEESRAEALSRMIEQDEAMRANAVINVRSTTSAITQSAAEPIAYGTAVKVA